MKDHGVTIAPLATVDEYVVCEQLQQEIWGAPPVDVVPMDLLITVQRHGGLVLGAFDPSGRMIGCLFSFAGRSTLENSLTKHGDWQLCSHIVGVIEEWRYKGIGYRLKRAQREWALAQGFEVITWTYNPLETANAALNIGKLGAVCACYLRNLYGGLNDALNQGLLSDRFEVVWQITSKRVETRMSMGRLPHSLPELIEGGTIPLNSAQRNKDGYLEPTTVGSPSGEQTLVEVPVNFQQIRAVDPDLALAWQLNVREACEISFEKGFIVTDVVKHQDTNFLRFYYFLSRVVN